MRTRPFFPFFLKEGFVTSSLLNSCHVSFSLIVVYFIEPPPCLIRA